MNTPEIWEAVLPRLRTYVTQTWDIEGLSKALGVAPGTVGDWLFSGRPANGERLIRLWHYMAAAGLDSPEIQTIPEFNRLAGQLLSMSIVTINDLKTVLNVSASQTVLQFLYGTTPMHPAGNEETLRAEYGEILEKALASVPKITMVNAGLDDRTPLEVLPSTSSVSEDYILMEAAMRLSGIAPLVRFLVSDECTPEDRSRFRDLIGQEFIFELSNNINSLCGERARGGR